MSAPEEKITVVILAAGKGTRMKSDLPKALHPLAGMPMAMWVVRTAEKLNPASIVMVVGHGREKVMDAFNGAGVKFAVQEPQLGTGHALACAMEACGEDAGTLLVLSADVPAISVAALKTLLEAKRGAVISMLTCRINPPGAYGRVIRKDGGVMAVVEARDASAEELKVDEINGGVYAIDARFAHSALSRLSSSNAQGEYYITDLVAMAVEGGGKVAGVMVDDPVQIQGVNTVEELKGLEKKLAGAPGAGNAE